MNTIRAWLSNSRNQRLALHDLAVFVAAFIATGVLDSAHLGWNVLAAAAVTAVKITVRQVLSVPPKTEDVVLAAQQLVSNLPTAAGVPVAPTVTVTGGKP